MTDNISINMLSLSGNDDEQLLDKTSSLSLEDPQEVPSNHFVKRSLVFQHEYTPRTSSPLKSSFFSSTDDLLSDDGVISEDHDVVMEDEDERENNSSFSANIAKGASLIMKPTMLGAKVATHGSPRPNHVVTNLSNQLQAISQDDEDDDDMGLTDVSISTSSQSSPIHPSLIKNRSKPRQSSNLAYEISASDSEDVTLDSSEPSSLDSSMNSSLTTTGHYNNRPIQLQINHLHNHYYSSPQSSFLTDNDDSDDSLLPAPWSKIAEPRAPTPYIISSYLQLLFNAITSSAAIYVLISAIKTVRSDIHSKMEEYAQDMAMEVSICARSYIENKCHPDTRAIALEETCIAWERCMNRDPTLMATKASVSAETLGLILNSLIEPIGGKAIVVVVLAFIAWSFTSNFIFGFVRAKSYYGWNPNTQADNSNNPRDQILRYGNAPISTQPQSLEYH